MGVFQCSRFGSLITFQCQCPRRQSLNHHGWVLPHQTPLQLDKEGIYESDCKKGGGREIIRGTRLIEGRDYSRKCGNLASVVLEGLN